MARLKKLIADLLLSFGYSIRSSALLNRTESLAKSGALLEILASSSMNKELTLQKAVDVVNKSKSQLGQDVLALSRVGLQQAGFFVEFGATNGIDLSNTYLLEKEFGWKGILCEPAKEWHEALMRNRACAIDTRCVYSSTGDKIEFSETSIGELSTISSFLDSDANRLIRKKTRAYDVETVSLEDLLSVHNAPEYVDLLSIDTEGSEFEILSTFNFSKYSFGLICVEHNFTKNRSRMRELLTGHGYKQVFSELSAFDDWYILDKSN